MMKKLFLSLLVGLLFWGSPLAHADTLTVYPDADPETSTVDGYVEESTATQTWASIQGAATGDTADTTDTIILQIDSSATTDRWDILSRCFFLFDTSSIDESATIDDATLSLYGFSKFDNLSIAPAIHVASSSPASDTNLVVGDFDQVGTTSFGSISYASLSAAGYNDFTLNASGEANISKTGVSKFSAQLGPDINNSEPTWSSSALTQIAIRGAENTGTTQDPKLVVNFTVATFTSRAIIID